MNIIGRTSASSLSQRPNGDDDRCYQLSRDATTFFPPTSTRSCQSPSPSNTFEPPDQTSSSPSLIVLSSGFRKSRGMRGRLYHHEAQESRCVERGDGVWDLDTKNTKGTKQGIKAAKWVAAHIIPPITNIFYRKSTATWAASGLETWWSLAWRPECWRWRLLEI